MFKPERIRDLRFSTSYFGSLSFCEITKMRNEIRAEYARMIKERETLIAQTLFYAKELERMYKEQDDAQDNGHQ